MTNPVENKINLAADSVEPSAEFSKNLWNQIRMTPRKENAPKRISRFVWIPAATVLGILLILAISAPQTVLAAVKGLLAYLPGTGFVQNSDSTLYLAEPVTVVKGDYTFTVDQVVANTEKVVVSYHMDGLSTDAPSCMYDGNQLLLPDGKTRLPIGGGAQGTSGRVEFAPLAEGVTQASLLSSMNFVDPNCSNLPQEWKVAFSLGTTVPEADLLPVVENTAAQAESEIPTDGSPLQMIVDRTVELSDGYLLTGHLAIANKDWQNAVIDMDSISALDANGKSVSVLPTDESFGEKEFSIKIGSKDFKGPLTIKVKALWIWANVTDAPTFTFDAGEDPQVGQSWTINKELTVAGKTIKVQNVKMVEDNSQLNQPSTLYGYSIQVGGENMNNLSLNCDGLDGPSSLFGQTKPLSTQELLVENYYPDGVPTSIVTCTLQDAQFKEAGDWKFEWQPAPAAE